VVLMYAVNGARIDQLPQGDTETNLLALLPSKLDDEVKKHSSTSYKGIGTEVHGDREDALVPLEAISRVEVSP